MPQLDPFTAADEADRRALTLPPEIDGRIPTLASASGNRYGAMATIYDSNFDEFVAIASANKSSRVLEIGAAYGSPYMMRALSNGGDDYTVVDVSTDQLRLLAKRVRDCYGSDRLCAIRLIDGSFPDASVVTELRTDYDAILAMSVLHFLDEAQVVEAFATMYRLLKPGAKLFARMSTPYLGIWTTECVDKWTNEIRQYLENGASMRPYPVQVMDFRQSIDMDKLIASKFTDIIGIVSSHCTFAFDADITKLMLESCNFIVEKCAYEPMHIAPFKRDGRERLIVIAKKPDLTESIERL